MGRIDDIANRYVADWAPLSPTGATYVGIAGYDDQLDDLSPGRVRGPRRADPAHPGRPRRDRAGLRDGAHRQGGHAGAARPGARPARRRRDDQRGQRDRQRAARAPHGLRPDADRGCGRPGQHRRPAEPVRRRAVEALQDDAARGGRGRPGQRRGAVGRGRQAVRHLDRPGRRQLLPRAGRAAGRRRHRSAPSCAGARRRPPRRPPSSARFLRTELAPHGRDKQAAGRERYELASQYFLGAKVDLDETYAWGFEELARLEAEMRAVAARIVGPGATDRRGGRGAGRRPGPDHPGQGGVPGLDAGARRQGDQRAARHPLRHSGAGPPDRVLPRADQRRRHLLHRPERGLLPPGPDVVGGAAGHHRLLHLARGDHGLPRGRTGSPPPGRADRGPGRAAQPLAAAALLGLRARRGLGALLRAADGRAGLPGGPGRQARHARRAGVPGGPGDRRHRHAPGAGDPAATTRSASTRASAGRRSWAGSSCGRTAGCRTRTCASS